LRYRFGEVTHPIPSRFLDEIGREGLETVESVKNFSSPSSSRYRRNGHQRKHEKQVDQYAVYHSDEVPDYHTASFDGEVHIGRLVEHEVFGRGTVLSVAGKGEERKAIVNFSSVGQKMLLLKYARLKLL